MKKLKGNFTSVLNKIITDKSISGNAFRILCYLCMRSGNDNSCFPSLDTIHQDKYLKERLEHEFKIREQLTKQLFNGGTDSKEFFESGGIRTADISGGDMLHTDEAKVAGSATDEGHGEFSAEAVQTDSNIGNEGTSGGNGTDNGGQAFDEQQKHYEQPDINECGNCSEDAEFVGTGWEESRAIYFEILRHAGRRSEQTQRDDKYAENASAQVFGDYNRGGNTILDIGFGAVSAVASLMDNDDCDDPEEKKKKLDAKDAGSNFGFALGVAVGLVGGLIAKSVKQDEEVVEKPPEEPKEDKEIDIDTYEESEDMDEDEGFTMQMLGKRTCSACSSPFLKFLKAIFKSYRYFAEKSV